MSTERPFVVVLAGGEGSRLISLTRALYGVDLPKQFAVLDGERSLLQSTIERALAITSEDRILVVITARYEGIARVQLLRYPQVELVIQPRNLDTAPGMLLPVARILARAPSAQVIFLPSDHYVVNPAPIERALEASAVPALADRITLIGVTPVSAEVEYGWIARGRPIPGSCASTVEAFREKPSRELAEQLRSAGALWNTFICAGNASHLWSLAQKYLPRVTAALESYSTTIGCLEEEYALEAAYQEMVPTNFSRDLLARTDALAVIAVSGTGWTDWGSPARVFASLEGTPGHARLLQRIRGDLDMAS
ncbi:MAG: sugar phosphate nucleotidyltransferase [Kofleriaceae bacterium]